MILDDKQNIGLSDIASRFCLAKSTCPHQGTFENERERQSLLSTGATSHQNPRTASHWNASNNGLE